MAQLIVNAPWNGQEWVINAHRDGAELVAWLDTTALPPFTELRYVWRGVRADMSSFETPPAMVEMADDACDWQRVEGPRVIVFVCDESSSAGRRARDVAEQQLDALERDLGLTLPGQARLVIVDQVSKMAAGTAYTRYGVMVVTDACACDATYLYDITIPHEVAHLALGRHASRLPVWFSEGVAMWAAPMELSLPATPFSWGEMQYRAYDDIAGMWRWYAQAAGITRYIEREYGLRALLDYLDAHANASIEDALRSVSGGLNSAQVMQEWRIAVGLEARPRKQMHPDALRQVVIGLHLVAVAGLSWWRVRLRLAGFADGRGGQ